MTLGSNPTAFVLMPFDPEFNPIYEDFIKSTLDALGFNVARADNIQSQRNILRDVIEGIVNDSLIIADLTGLNPNVFYELGIAHAVRKPVLLITQSIEDVPFDLRSYRLVEYDVHFARIGEAREKLNNYAKGFLENRVKFGNPFTDFLPGDGNFGNQQSTGAAPEIPKQSPEPCSGETEGLDDRGLFDHLVDVNEGYNQIAAIIEEVTTDLGGLTAALDVATNDFSAISSNPGSSPAVAVQRVARRAAKRISDFNQHLAQANVRYAGIAEGIEDSLEFVIGFFVEQDQLNDPNVIEQISTLRDSKATAIEGRDSFLELANTMDGMPRIERRLNREVARGSEEVRIMAGNIDRTIGSINRALNRFE